MLSSVVLTVDGDEVMAKEATPGVLGKASLVLSGYRHIAPGRPIEQCAVTSWGGPTTRRRRPALIALVIIATCGCLALGWWQWTRFQSTSGTFQNLGYALQWPLFAWFCVYAYRNFVRYEETPPQPPTGGAAAEIPAGLLPERPKPAQQPPDDPVLREYNAYLAELAKDDARKQNRTTA